MEYSFQLSLNGQIKAFKSILYFKYQTDIINPEII
jgi:hypothetical protein